MTTPYHYRIMAALPSGEPVELHRSQKSFCRALWNSITRDLSEDWTVWIERPMQDKMALTPRVPTNQGEVL